MALNFGLLDTSIPERLGAMPANALAMRRQRIAQDEDRAFQREGQQTQNALARMQMTKAQGEMDEDAAYKNALRGVQGGDYRTAMPDLMQASPSRAMALQKQLSEQEKGGMEMTIKKLDVMDKASGMFAANPTRQGAMDTLDALESIGTPPDILAKMKQKLDATPDDQIPEMARQYLAATKEGIKAQTERLFPSMSEFEKTTGLAGMSPEEQAAAARARITKETTHAPSSVTNVNMGLEREEQKAKGKSNVEMYGDIRTDASVARKLNAQFESQSRTLDAGFKTGFGTEAKTAAANVLASLGVEDAAQYATNAQTFKAAAIEAVLQKQLAQKGPQTESDAKRIAETGTQLGNTTEANRFVIDIARAQNDKAIKQQEFFDKYWRSNGTYEGAEAAWYDGEGGKSLFESPRMSKYSGATSGASQYVETRRTADGRVLGKKADGTIEVIK
jgi:hypothetical protein